jgi:hypothetical protein
MSDRSEGPTARIRQIRLHQIDDLHAEVNQYRDSVALLRVRLYRRGIRSNKRLEELQARLESARRRLREARANLAR